MATTRTPQLGPAARPVAVPDDLDKQGNERMRGMVELPFHIRWSGPPIIYDLECRADRVRVYEQVLREGTDDDVRRFVDPDELLKLWGDLVLPPTVRRAWAMWFHRHRGIGPAC